MFLEKTLYVTEMTCALCEWHTLHYVGHVLLLCADRHTLYAEGNTSKPCVDRQEAVTTITDF